MTLWGTDTVQDVAESVGALNLNKEVTYALCRDVEYRVSLVLEQALKFMRHARRTVLWTQDIANALKVLDVEPLYGYETTRPLKYGEASIGPLQPLFYVEDEETDFEKLINAPLPRVPREINFTAHWLAVEGVQPSIPQNPTSNDARNLELLAKGPNANPALAAMAGSDSTTTKPQVKHILSKELQLYFEKVCSSILDETQPEYRTAGLASLREDPGLHQLVPYFVQFVAEKVTHGLKDLFVLTQMMNLTDSLTRNEKLNLSPYIASMVPPVLTCLIGRNLGPPPSSTNPQSITDSFDLRDLAASLLRHLCDRYAKFSHNLKPRLARSCLKTFLDPKKPYGTHYGAILGFMSIGGGSDGSGSAEVVRALVVPNLKVYAEEVLKPGLEGGEGETKRVEAERVLVGILRALNTLVDEDVPMMNGYMNGHRADGDEARRSKLVEKVGATIGSKVLDTGRDELVRAIVDS